MKLKTLSIGLVLIFFLSLGLGKYFDSRCEKGCLRTIAENQKGNFHITFGDDHDHDDDFDVDVAGKMDEPKLLHFEKIDKLEELEIQLIQTELDIKRGTSLMIKAEGIVNDKAWKINTTEKKMVIDMRDKGPDSLHLELPAEFKGRIVVNNVSGEIVIGPDIVMEKLSLNSASGDIKLQSLPTEELSINTVSGDFQSDAPKAVTKNIHINGVSADFKFEINSGFQNLKIQTVSGDVALKINGKADFDYRMHAISGDFKGIPGGVLKEAIADKEMKGTVGESGKSSVVFESISGDFTLTL